MTSAEYIEAERLRKTGGVAEYTQEYLDAKKTAERKERWCGRNWVRMLTSSLPLAVVWILIDRWSVLWVYKFGLYVVCLAVSQGFYAHIFSRAVRKRLDAELRAR